MSGPGDFGRVTVLSPDPKSGFSIWETTSRLENRECNLIGAQRQKGKSQHSAIRIVASEMDPRHLPLLEKSHALQRNFLSRLT